MAESTTIEAVKAAIGISGTAMDTTIGIWTDEVTDYMIGAGVSAEKVASSLGVIARGVDDIWKSGGAVSFSEFFKDRVIQLALRSGGDS